jgi:hypothetical protein
MEYQVVGEVVQNVETLEAALQDVHGCAKMPADLKRFWKRNKDFIELLSLYGKLLSKDIVKYQMAMMIQHRLVALLYCQAVLFMLGHLCRKGLQRFG